MITLPSKLLSLRCLLSNIRVYLLLRLTLWKTVIQVLSSEISKTWPFIKCGPYNLRQHCLKCSVSKRVSLFRASCGRACQKQWIFDLKLRILKPSNHFSILRASLNQKDAAEFEFEHILSTFNRACNAEIWKVKTWLCIFKKSESVQPHLARVQTSLLVHRLLVLARRCTVLIFCNADRWQELRSLHLEGNGLYFKKLRGYSQILGKELPRSVAFCLLSEKEVVEEELRTALWEDVEDIEDEPAHDASGGTTGELVVESLKVRSHNSRANKYLHICLLAPVEGPQHVDPMETKFVRFRDSPGALQECIDEQRWFIWDILMVGLKQKVIFYRGASWCRQPNTSQEKME